MPWSTPCGSGLADERPPSATCSLEFAATGFDDSLRGVPQLDLIDGGEIDDPRVRRLGHLGRREVSQPRIQQIAFPPRLVQVIDERTQVAGRGVGIPANLGQPHWVEPFGGSVDDEPTHPGGGGLPARRELSRFVGRIEEVLVGLGAAVAALERGRLGSYPFEVRKHLGVLAASGAVLRQADFRGDRRELVEELILPVASDGRGFDLLGERLQRGASLRQLRMVVEVCSARHQSQVARLQQHEAAQGIQGRRHRADQGQGRRLVVQVSGGRRPTVGHDLDGTPGAILEGEYGVFCVTAERTDETVGERLTFQHADAREDGQVFMEVDLELVARNA